MQSFYEYGQVAITNLDNVLLNLRKGIKGLMKNLVFKESSLPQLVYNSESPSRVELLGYYKELCSQFIHNIIFPSKTRIPHGPYQVNSKKEHWSKSTKKVARQQSSKKDHSHLKERWCQETSQIQTRYRRP